MVSPRSKLLRSFVFSPLCVDLCVCVIICHPRTDILGSMPFFFFQERERERDQLPSPFPEIGRLVGLNERERERERERDGERWRERERLASFALPPDRKVSGFERERRGGERERD